MLNRAALYLIIDTRDRLVELGFDPRQPRWPKGSGKGGQWRDSASTPARPKDLKSGDEAEAMFEAHDFAAPKATEQDELASVTLNSYREISEFMNGYLRGSRPNFKDYLRKGSKSFSTKESADALAHLIDQHESKAPVQVFRGMNFTPEGLEVGAVIRDKGFLSTSFDVEVAKSFLDDEATGEPAEDGVLFDIYVPKGSKGVLLPQDDEEMYDESELLLQRGAAIHITAIEERDGVTYVQGTLEQA